MENRFRHLPHFVPSCPLSLLGSLAGRLMGSKKLGSQSRLSVLWHSPLPGSPNCPTPGAPGSSGSLRNVFEKVRVTFWNSPSAGNVKTLFVCLFQNSVFYFEFQNFLLKHFSQLLSYYRRELGAVGRNSWLKFKPASYYQGMLAVSRNSKS